MSMAESTIKTLITLNFLKARDQKSFIMKNKTTQFFTRYFTYVTPSR
jgi:hypothetical protein